MTLNEILALTNNYCCAKYKDMTINEDVFILFEETPSKKISEYLLEGISKEQKEIAQRAMAKKEIEILPKLKNYLDNKWKNKSSKDYKQMELEYARLNFIIKAYSDISKESNTDIANYVKNVTEVEPQWFINKGKSNATFLDSNNQPRIIIANDKDINKIKPLDYAISNNNAKKISKIIRQEIILHEYGHLYDFLKMLIDTGEAYITDTLRDDANKVIESEEKANAFAIDNMYRKDRRKLLSVSSYSTGKLSGNLLTDYYRLGTLKHSKTIKNVLNSLNYEKANKSLELQKIYFCSSIIEDRFKELGYKVPHITYLVVNGKEKNNLQKPLWHNNGNKIYIDYNAFMELVLNNEACFFYIPIEVSHIIANKNNTTFEKCLEKWNKKYPKQKISPQDNHDKEYLPTYYEAKIEGQK